MEFERDMLVRIDQAGSNIDSYLNGLEVLLEHR